MRVFKLSVGFAFVIAFFNCCDRGASDEPALDLSNRINNIENGLINPVFIQGDIPFNIEDRMKHYGVPGVSIAIINNFQIAWTKSYGIMDSSSMDLITNETLFQAGSISKPVAAYAALRLVQEKQN